MGDPEWLPVCVGVTSGEGIATLDRASHAPGFSGPVVDAAWEASMRCPPGLLIVSTLVTDTLDRLLLEEGLSLGSRFNMPGGQDMSRVQVQAMALIGNGSEEGFGEECAEVIRSILQMDEVSDWLMWNSSALTRGDRMGIGSSSETFEGLFAGSAVAIKRPMITVLPPDVRAHLISLASHAHAIKSKHLCPILALSVADYDTHIVLPRYASNLASLMESGQALPEARVRKLVHDMVSGLQDLQAASLTHGQLNLTNVLIADDGRAVLADYSLGPVALSAQTMTGASNIHFLAPERIRGEVPTLESDVYALGIITFLMLTGWETPYPQIPSQLTIANRVLSEKLVPDLSHVPSEWMFFLQGCFEPVPSRASLSRLNALLASM